MTKTLTEQWREGTLPLGTYYIVDMGGNETIDKSVCVGELWDNSDVQEILAPVPSYDEYKELLDLNVYEKLQKQLKIATKALSDIEDGYSEATGAGQTVRQALKEMEGVK